MKKQKILERGFTLLELLVVVAIIGLLTAVIMVSLSSARSKGDDAAIKSNLHTVANQMELNFSNNGNYGAEDYRNSNCPGAYNSSSTLIFRKDKIINDALAEAVKRSSFGSAFCAVNDINISAAWGIAVVFKSNPKYAWCVDSTGVSKKIGDDSSPNITDTNQVLNSVTHVCN